MLASARPDIVVVSSRQTFHAEMIEAAGPIATRDHDVGRVQAGWDPTLHLPLEVLKRCTEEVLHASTLIVAIARLELSGVISSILLLSAGRPY